MPVGSCPRSPTQTAGASQAEETGEWRHPDDLAALLARPEDRRHWPPVRKGAAGAGTRR